MHINKLLMILGAFAKLGIATISFVMSVGPSVCPLETTSSPIYIFPSPINITTPLVKL